MDGLETPPENTIAGKLPGSAIDDRLSSLPDEILSQILSFLPTKYAVGTAVLSRRWTDLWTRVSNLDFDNKLAYKQLDICWIRDSPTQLANRVSRDFEFSRFVDRVLSQHRNLNAVRRFRLHFEVFRRNWRLRPNFVRTRESVFGSLVEEIDVSLVGAMEFGSPARIWWLPESFYTLKNLKAVKLDHVMMGADGPVSLPSLKILQLRQVVIEDFEMLSKLISGCPALESLDLHDCLIEYGNENDILAASLPSLRNFKIYVDIGGELCDIEIEAPNLEHVVLLCFADVKFLGSSPLPCLHSARVDTGESRTISIHCLMGLLTQISNAKEMSLDWPTLVINISPSSLKYTFFITHRCSADLLTLVFRNLCWVWMMFSCLFSPI
ncbi:unnamed protein product [Linum tenue]|uniref:F-box domain-containing protein n=1 Tax=Linum tenue TaxID=586396 RepID=A0AAV0P6Z6_9ROSI|nr:unnamed protein product [Linum tenue]